MIHVPAFEQSNTSTCGPACLRMVLAYYGLEKTEKELAERCKHTFEKGCKTEDMKWAAESYGFSATVKSYASFEEIQECVNQRVPVIVDWFTGGVNPGMSDTPNGHSSVVVGLDEEKIHLLDPENGEIRHLTREAFLRCWFDWASTDYLHYVEQLILRQMLVIKPKKLVGDYYI